MQGSATRGSEIAAVPTRRPLALQTGQRPCMLARNMQKHSMTCQLNCKCTRCQNLLDNSLRDSLPPVGSFWWLGNAGTRSTQPPSYLFNVPSLRKPAHHFWLYTFAIFDALLMCGTASQGSMGHVQQALPLVIHTPSGAMRKTFGLVNWPKA